MRSYPDWIEAMVQVTEVMPSPERFRRWAAISAVSGALGRKCWWDAGLYKIGTQQFIFLVGGPGTGKGTAIKTPYNEIFCKLGCYLHATNPEHKDWSRTYRTYHMERPVRFAKDRITSEKLLHMLAENLGLPIPELSTISHAFFDSSCTAIVEEWGTFMRKNEASTLPTLSELWDFKDTQLHQTLSGGEKMIKGPCLNLIAGATPSELVDRMPDSARGQGFLSRAIVVAYFGQATKASLFADPIDTSRLEMLKHDFASIARLKGPFTLEGGRRGAFAQRVDEWWFGEHQIEAALPEYGHRRQAHMMKLAMAISAARSDDMVITEADWERAMELLLDVEETMPLALAGFGRSELGRLVTELVEIVRQHPKGIGLTKLKRAVVQRARNVNDVDKTLEIMEKCGYILQKDQLVYPR